jgi:4-pyridoxate dehydrogenase
VLDGRRAIGVEYVKRGARITVHADREVILAAGVINTPQLLMLSGIGDPDDLRPHGIAVRAPLNGVGRNLQDHISAGILWRRTEPGPLHAKMRLDRIAFDLGKTYFFGSGISADLPGGVMAFLKSPLAGLLPDVQFLFAGGPLEATPYLPPFSRPYADSFGCRAVMLRPESRGRLDLVSADPRQPMRIRQNFLATGKDWATLRAGLRLVRSRIRPRYAHLLPMRSRRGPAKSRTRRSMRISGRPGLASITHLEPARWARRAMRRRWSTASCAFSGSTGCASSTPR